jgi:broad-specificity NMP kinase
MEDTTIRVIIITGTPGVGKTTVAKELAKSLSSNVLDVSELVQKENLVSMSDDRRETLIADMKKLRTRVRGILSKTKDSIVIEGHYAYDVVPKPTNTMTFVLRRDPDDLEQKLRRRGYDDRKISENIAAEAQVIIGARINKDFEGRVRVITIMTGVSSPYILGKHRMKDYGYESDSEMSDLGIEIVRDVRDRDRDRS